MIEILVVILVVIGAISVVSLIVAFVFNLSELFVNVKMFGDRLSDIEDKLKKEKK